MSAKKPPLSGASSLLHATSSTSSLPSSPAPSTGVGGVGSPSSSAVSSSAAKQRKASAAAAREEADRAARADAEEAQSMRTYNEMLRNLLSKELTTRETAEARVKELEEQFETFRTTELETLKATHANTVLNLEQTLTARLREEHDARMEAQVSSRVMAARAADLAKYRDLGDLQAKLRAEFEDKYSKRLAQLEAENKQLSEALTATAARVDSQTAAERTFSRQLAAKESLVLALERRCSNLDQLRTQTRGLRAIIKYLTVRTFVHAVRTKRHLRGVYGALHQLHSKLNADPDYDRTSPVILPQHELETWLGKTHALLMRGRQAQQAQQATFNAIFGGGSSNSAANQLPPPPTSASPASPANASDHAPTTRALVPASGGGGGGGATGATPASKRARRQASQAMGPSQALYAAIAAAAYLPESRSGGNGGGGNGWRSKASSPTSATSRAVNVIVAVERPDLSLGLGGLAHALHFHSLLSSLSDVETVLRGCLVEALSKAAEWKASSEDFFLRNQELVSDALQLREARTRAVDETRGLQASLAMMEKTLRASQDERQAMREIDAQAPKHLVQQARSLSAAVTRRLTTASTNAASRDQNGLDRDLILRGVDLDSGANLVASLESKKPLNQAPLGTAPAPVSVESQTATLIASHRRLTRLSHIDGTSTKELLALSARDLDDLGRGRAAGVAASGPSATSSSSGGGGGPLMRLGGPRGFFDHHNALMRCAIAQKTRIESLERALASARAKLRAEKDRTRQARATHDFAWEVATKMDDDVAEAEASSQKGEEEENDAFDQSRTSNHAPDEKESEEAPSNNGRRHPTPTDSARQTRSRTNAPFSFPPSEASSLSSSACGTPGPYPPQPPFRPQQLDLEEDLQGDGRLLRATIPFSPPVYPVSPYAPPTATGTPAAAVSTAPAGASRPHSSGGIGVAGSGSSTSRSHTPGSARRSLPSSSLRGPSLTVSVPPSGLVSARTRSNRSSTPGDLPSRAHSASGARGGGGSSIGAQLLTGSLLARTQPVGHMSASYAAARVHSPGLCIASPASPNTHASTRAPERVYGHGAGTATSGGAHLADHFSRAGSSAPRTINPLLAVGLASGPVIAAALTAQGARLPPESRVTGDVRYDIISPYVPRALPWERRDPVRYTNAAHPTTAATAEEQEDQNHEVPTDEHHRRDRTAARSRKSRPPPSSRSRTHSPQQQQPAVVDGFEDEKVLHNSLPSSRQSLVAGTSIVLPPATAQEFVAPSPPPSVDSVPSRSPRIANHSLGARFDPLQPSSGVLSPRVPSSSASSSSVVSSRPPSGLGFASRKTPIHAPPPSDIGTPTPPPPRPTAPSPAGSTISSSAPSRASTGFGSGPGASPRGATDSNGQLRPPPLSSAHRMRVSLGEYDLEGEGGSADANEADEEEDGVEYEYEFDAPEASPAGAVAPMRRLGDDEEEDDDERA